MNPLTVGLVKRLPAHEPGLIRQVGRQLDRLACRRRPAAAGRCGRGSDRPTARSGAGFPRRSTQAVPLKKHFVILTPVGRWSDGPLAGRTRPISSAQGGIFTRLIDGQPPVAVPRVSQRVRIFRRASKRP